MEWSEEDQEIPRTQQLWILIMKLSTIVVMTTVALMLQGCMGGGSRPDSDLSEVSKAPDWILNSPQKSGALYSVGSADIYGSLEQAQSRAREIAMANLMQQIEVDIDAKTDIVSEQKESSEEGYEFSQSLRQEISTRVPRMQFSYMEPIESFEDKEKSQVYVLMRLDVNQEISAAKNKASQLKNEIHRLSDIALDENADIFSVVQSSAESLLALETYRQLHQFTMRLQPQGTGLPLSDELQRLKQRVLKRMGEVQVSISPLNGQGIDHTISQMLGEQIGKRGMRIAQTGITGEVQLRYRLKQTNRFRDDTFFVTIDGIVELQDKQGVVIRSFESSARGVSTDEVAAIRRALAKLGKKVANEVVEAFFNTKES